MDDVRLVLGKGADAALAADAMPLREPSPVPAGIVSAFASHQTFAAVSLANLNQTYDGTPKDIAVTTSPADLPVSITYDGNPDAPTNADVYDVVAAVTAADYAGGATGTLVIAKGIATISLGNLSQGYDGATKAVIAATNPVGLAVNLTYNRVSSPPTTSGIYLVEAEIADANYSGAASDRFAIVATALVRHAPTLYGAIDGSIQVLSDESILLNDNAWISGDLLVPGLPAVHVIGSPIYAGTQDGTGAALPTDYSVTLGSNALLRHTLRRIDPIALPAVGAPPVPPGTRDVEINSDEEDAGDFATLRDLALKANGRALAIPPGTYGRFAATNCSSLVVGLAGATVPAIYNFQSLTLAGNSRLDIEGPVILVVANGMSIDQMAGAVAHPEWLVLEISGGGLVLSGRNAVFNGNVIAPSGTIVIGDNAVLNGAIAADRLIISGNGLLQDPNQ